MDSSSVVWENKDWNGGGKHKKITLKTLDKLSFWLEIFALNLVEKKPLNRVGKTGLKTLQKSYTKQPPKVSIYRARKTSRWEPDWPVGRPPGRPANGQNSDRWASGRPAGRPWPGYRELSSLPVDRQSLEGYKKGIWKLDFLTKIKSHKIMKNLQK